MLQVEGGIRPQAVEVVTGRAKSVTIVGAHWGELPLGRTGSSSLFVVVG